MKKIIVIGAGAAGMMAGIAAAQAGADVTIIEKNEKAGKKIYITGKGRCNVTNAGDREDFFNNIVTNPKFLYSSFAAFNNYDMMDLLENEGLKIKTERGNRVFPVSDKSSDVIKTLTAMLQRLNVRILYNTPVTGLITEELADGEKAADGVRKADGADGDAAAGTQPDGTCANASSGKTAAGGNGKKGRAVRKWKVTGVKLADGTALHADAVITACGGLSYPLTGSTGDGYGFARKTGHTVTDCYPALIPFNAHLDKGIACKALMGLTLKNTGFRIYRGKKLIREDFGELLFTHFGVSGPMVLSAGSVMTKALNEKADGGPAGVEKDLAGLQNGMGSAAPQKGRGSAAKRKKEPVVIVLDLKPALSEEQLDARFVRDFSEMSGKNMSNILRKAFPATLVPVILKLAGISAEKKGSEVTKEERKSLVSVTKSFIIHVDGTRDFSEAIITQGGVSVKETDPATMESRLVKDLYFAGEMLDVDAFTGGYNLQIAWTTGHAAGASAAKQEEWK
ncbi:MAG: NAD(P)/FAD-dependent oxidoreductase [Lachnospiraceae bacterium]|nr:NAD(P)/FAD-dependent oxidoreductase [Lachnospiraceae bacterium]